MKKKIKTRIEEHREYIKYAKQITALYQLNLKEDTHINFNNITKFENYTLKKAHFQEAIEIISKNNH